MNKGILSKGQVSESVASLQRNLKTLGYLSGAADGAFGTATENAVKSFQKDFSQKVTGLIDKKTLNDIIDGKYKKETTEVIPNPNYGEAEVGKGEKTTQPPQKFGSDYLGCISEKHETSGVGCGTISSGANDIGGESYGSYQLSSTEGAVEEFMEWTENSHPRMYKLLHDAYEEDGNKLGDNFKKAWTDLANDHNYAFSKAQYEYAKKIYYDASVKKIKENNNFDVDNRSFALKSVIFSRAVQHGGCSVIFDRAIKSNNIDLTTPKDDEIIKAIYKECSKFATTERAKGKAKMSSNETKHKEAWNKTLHYFVNSNAKEQAAVYQRLKYDEPAYALDLYEKYE